MQCSIDLISIKSVRSNFVRTTPVILEGSVIVLSARSTGAVPTCKCRCLIQKEQLRIFVQLSHQLQLAIYKHPALPIAEAHPTRHPGFVLPILDHWTIQSLVENSTVSH